MFLNVFWRRFWCKFNAIFLVYVRFGRRFGTRHRPTYSATLRVLIHGFESRPTGWEPQIRKAEPALSLGRSDDSQHSNPATSCERGQNSISDLVWLGACQLNVLEMLYVRFKNRGPAGRRVPALHGSYSTDYN